MAEQIFVAAAEVEPGSYIPGLDNAYVFEVDHDPDLRCEYNTNVAQGLVMVTYHDSEGEEGYLLLTPATRIEVLRQ